VLGIKEYECREYRDDLMREDYENENCRIAEAEEHMYEEYVAGDGYQNPGDEKKHFRIPVACFPYE